MYLKQPTEEYITIHLLIQQKFGLLSFNPLAFILWQSIDNLTEVGYNSNSTASLNGVVNQRSGDIASVFDDLPTEDVALTISVN